HHDVEVLRDGSNTVDVCAQQPPALVLLDVRLPDIDGFELIAPLRREVPDAAIVMMTGHPSVPRAVEAMKAGATNFLEKPLDPERLVQLLEQTEARLAARDGRFHEPL